ncbi:MAG: hypothetical protein GC161_18320 [Planctomycetaceae bacterium]|nr:hypothetical protein [Planctomycetaceae bacterium]
MSQATLFERKRKRPVTSMAAKLWDLYGATAEDRRRFAALYQTLGGQRPGRATDRAMAFYLRQEIEGVTWRVVQDFRLKLGTAMGGGTHPHRGSRRRKVQHTGKIDDVRFYPRTLSEGELRLEMDTDPARAVKHHSDHLNCCGIGPSGELRFIGSETLETLQPKEPPAEPEPLPDPARIAAMLEPPKLAPQGRPLPPEPRPADLAARFLERMFETGQVGLRSDRLSPEEAAQVAKRAAQALVEA